MAASEHVRGPVAKTRGTWSLNLTANMECSQQTVSDQHSASACLSSPSRLLCVVVWTRPCFVGGLSTLLCAGCLSGNGHFQTDDWASSEAPKSFACTISRCRPIDVPQSASLYRYIDKKDFDTAYQVACLGVTDGDWRLLALDALQNLRFEIARKSFIRIRDMRYIDLLGRITQQYGNRTSLTPEDSSSVSFLKSIGLCSFSASLPSHQPFKSLRPSEALPNCQ